MKKGSTKNHTADCCDGRLVKVEGDKLSFTCENGDKHQYKVSKDARVTCDDKASKLADLKKGATIRMTMCNDDKDTVIAVDCGKHIPELATT